MPICTNFIKGCVTSWIYIALHHKIIEYQALFFSIFLYYKRTFAGPFCNASFYQVAKYPE